MHRDLRKYLTDAEGASDQVVVVFLDVRGFSTFAGMAESSQAALFLRNMYIQILDEYFPEAAFFKPTGDGLMIVRHIDRENLESVVHDSIAKSVALVGAFATISDPDPMINFEVPGSLGIGIARGPATSLVSGDLTLDYSGRPLNLASRLMDLARPVGVVVDGQVMKGLAMPDAVDGVFVEDRVFVKGIADLKPIDIYKSTEVIVPSANRRPLVGKPHIQVLDSIANKDVAALKSHWHHTDLEPIDPDSVTLEVRVPTADGSGRRRDGLVEIFSFNVADVRRSPDGWSLMYDYGQLARILATREKVRSNWILTRALRYSVPDDSDGKPDE